MISADKIMSADILEYRKWRSANMAPEETELYIVGKPMHV